MQTAPIPQIANVDLKAIVNTASVKHLSPFRYPGGKTWLVPRILQWLQSRNARCRTLIDPFTGGGSVPLAMLSEGMVDRIVLAEIDEDVAAVWISIFGRDNVGLAKRILDFKMGREQVAEALSQPPHDSLDRAFKTILKNRTFRGGILADGASLMKTGENGRGVASRWYPETLARRIHSLYQLRNRVDFHFRDGLEIVRTYADASSCALFIDPPYTVGRGAGSRLYRHHQLDHATLFSLAAAGRPEFVMTYDESPEVLKLASQCGFRIERIAMKNTHHKCKNELFISRY